MLAVESGHPVERGPFFILRIKRNCLYVVIQYFRPQTEYKMHSLGYKLRIPTTKCLHYLLFLYLFTKATGVQK